MTEEEAIQLKADVDNLKNSFANFSFKVNKKIGGSGTRESVIQIANGSKLCIGSGNNVMKFDENGLYLGNATFASAPFRVTMAGALTATSATISGSVTANAIDAGTGNSSAHIDSNGNLWVGHANYASAPAKISNAGVATFVSATLTGSTVNSSVLSFQDAFSDGSDGDLTTSGNVTLTADAFYNNLTVSTGHTFDMAGFRLFVKGTLTVNGTLQRTPNNGGNGGDGQSAVAGGAGGAAGTAGGALADGSLKGALAGVAGIAGANRAQVTSDNSKANGTNGNAGSGAGTDVAKSLSSSDGIVGVTGNTSGNATVPAPGTATGGTGGAGSAAGVRTGTVFNKIRNSLAAYLMYDFFPAGDSLKSAPSNGSCGSSGTGACATGVDTDAFSGGSGGSGGGGSQGGIATIFARIIVIGATGVIQCNGGNGGNGGGGGTGLVVGDNGAVGGTSGSPGGDGGNGGILVLVYSSLTNSGTLQAIGGTGGTGGAASAKVESGTGTATNGVTGTSGTNGTAGTRIDLII